MGPLTAGEFYGESGDFEGNDAGNEDVQLPVVRVATRGIVAGPLQGIATVGAFGDVPLALRGS